MDDNNLQTWSAVCSTEYGNPSGHSQFAAGFNSFMFLDIFHGSLKGRIYNKLWYYFWAFIAIALAALVCFARFYVMVHTLNQIVYGASLGIWTTCYFHFCLRDPLIAHIKNITELPGLNFSYQKLIIISTLIFVVEVMAQVATYLLVDYYFQPQAYWLINMANECGTLVGVNFNYLNYSSLIVGGVPSVTYGAYLGMLFQRFKFGRMWKNLYKTSILKAVGRLCVVALVGVPFGIPFIAIPSSTAFGIQVAFKGMIPLIPCGFMIFGVSNPIMERLKLVNIKTSKLSSIEDHLSSSNLQEE